MPRCKTVVLFKEHWCPRSPSATQHKCHSCWISSGTRQLITTWLAAVWNELPSKKVIIWPPIYCICSINNMYSVFLSLDLLNHIWRVLHVCCRFFRQCRPAAVWSMSSYWFEFQRLFPASGQWVISLWWASLLQSLNNPAYVDITPTISSDDSDTTVLSPVSYLTSFL